MFIYRGIRYIVEFDGAHHFRFEKFFHKSYDDFLFKQEIDRVKTHIAIVTDYKLVHIDYKEISRVDYHLNSAFED